MDLQLSGML